MDYKLQNIIFPMSADLETKSNLYYRGMRGILDRKNKKIDFSDRTWIDFTTYINGCSYSKWKKYTDIKGLKLKLKIKGNAEIVLVGYKLNVCSPVREELGRYWVNSDEATLFEANYPDNDALIVGFEINTVHGVTVYGGEFWGEYEKAANDVTLCVCTTTCRKEEYITKNIELVKKEILEDSVDRDIREHFFVHVIDNGRTLDADSMKAWHVDVHPNKNTGGSGGFTRGMLEAMHQTPRATHVLLMDDDVIVLPESIKRTYRLFQLVNEKYKDAVVSGAMLYLEEMDLQHEDVGTIRRSCILSSLKGKIRQDTINSNLINEIPAYASSYTYAAWWYCGIPVSQIDKHGLPLPFFIRIDDVEYGRRLDAKIMSMNGLCIWHMGFSNKYNAAIDIYQQCRNALIGQAIGSFPEDIRVFDYIYKYFRAELLKFNYGGAQMAFEALRDYLKGPDFIEQDLGEKLLKEHVKLNEKFVSLSEFSGIEWNLPGIGWQEPRKKLDTLWYRLTFNGHRLWPEKWLKKEPAQTLFGPAYTPQKYVRRQTLYAINPDLKVLAVRKIDKKRYRELIKQWRTVVREYKRNNSEVKKAYLNKKSYLTSVEFWEKYLEIKVR